MAQRAVSFACNTLRTGFNGTSLSKAVGRRALSSGKKEVVKPPQHVLEKMSNYQAAEESTPVYVIAGALDQIIYRMTFGCCILGLGGFVTLIYNLGFKSHK